MKSICCKRIRVRPAAFLYMYVVNDCSIFWLFPPSPALHITKQKTTMLFVCHWVATTVFLWLSFASPNSFVYCTDNVGNLTVVQRWLKSINLLWYDVFMDWLEYHLVQGETRRLRGRWYNSKCISCPFENIILISLFFIHAKRASKMYLASREFGSNISVCPIKRPMFVTSKWMSLQEAAMAARCPHPLWYRVSYRTVRLQAIYLNSIKDLLDNCLKLLVLW